MYLPDYTTVVLFLSCWQWCIACACSADNVRHGPRIEEISRFRSERPHGSLVRPPPSLVHQRFQLHKRLASTHTPFSTDAVMRSSWPPGLLVSSMTTSQNVESDPVSADPSSEVTTVATSRQTGQEYSSPGVQHTMEMDETKRVSIASNTVTQYTNTMDEERPEPAPTSHPAVLEGSSATPTSSTTFFQYITQFGLHTSSESFRTKYQDNTNEQPVLEHTRTSIQAIKPQDEQGYTSTTKQSPAPEEESDRASKSTPHGPESSMALAESSSGTALEYPQNRSTESVLRITSQSIISSQGPSSNSQETIETGSGEPTSITLMAHINPPLASDDSSRPVSSSIQLSPIATTVGGNGPPVVESKARTIPGLSGYTTADSAHRGDVNEQRKSFPTGLSLSTTKTIDLQGQSATSFGRPESEPGLSTIITSGIWPLAPAEPNPVPSTSSLNAPTTLSQSDARIKKPSEASGQSAVEENRDRKSVV